MPLCAALTLCARARRLLFSGAALLGGMGYLYVAQREVLMKLVQVPLMVAKLVLAKSWALLLKPILRKIIQLKGSAGGAGAGLPGGSY